MARRWLSGKEYPAHASELEGLKLLVREDEKLVSGLPRRRLRVLLRTAYWGWLLYRARQRESVAKKKAETYRSRILEILPEGTVRGIESRIGRPMRVLVVEQVGVRVAEPLGFLNYLGPHVADIVQRVEVAPVVTIDPSDWERLAGALKTYVGGDEKRLDELLSINLVFDLDKLKKKIEAGDLPEPGDELFTLEARSPRVDAKPLA